MVTLGRIAEREADNTARGVYGRAHMGKAFVFDGKILYVVLTSVHMPQSVPRGYIILLCSSPSACLRKVPGGYGGV